MKGKIARIFLFLGLFFLVLLQGIPALAVPTVTPDVLDHEIWPGEQFTINVVAYGVTDPDEVIAFGFDCAYDPSWFRNGYTIGPDFTDDSSLSPDIAGSIKVTDPLSPPLRGDNILLASLFFTPFTAGTFDFGIFSDLSDPNEGLFTLLSQFDITTSVPVHVVPEPCTLLLLGPALGALVKLRKRS
jgi:hypothetical protein